MSSRTRALAGTLTLVLLVGGGFFLWKSGFFAVLSSPQALRDYILRFSPFSHGVFFLIQLLSVILAPIPSNVSALAGGMIFGTWPAFFLTMAAVFTGSVTVFLLARVLGQSFADRLVSRRLSEKYQTVIRAKTATFLTLAFLLPYFPDDVLCILAGLTAIPLPHFLVILVLTRPWGLLFASALGGASLTVPLPLLVLFGVLGAALFFFGMKYGDRLEGAILRRLGRQKIS